MAGTFPRLAIVTGADTGIRRHPHPGAGIGIQLHGFAARGG